MSESQARTENKEIKIKEKLKPFVRIAGAAAVMATGSFGLQKQPEATVGITRAPTIMAPHHSVENTELSVEDASAVKTASSLDSIAQMLAIYSGQLDIKALKAKDPQFDMGTFIKQHRLSQHFEEKKNGILDVSDWQVDINGYPVIISLSRVYHPISLENSQNSSSATQGENLIEVKHLSPAGDDILSWDITIQDLNLRDEFKDSFASTNTDPNNLITVAEKLSRVESFPNAQWETNTNTDNSTLEEILLSSRKVAYDNTDGTGGTTVLEQMSCIISSQGDLRLSYTNNVALHSIDQ